MLRTIAIGSSILVQGQPEGVMPDGKLVLRVGDRLLQGWPVDFLPLPKAAAETPALTPA